MSLAEIRYVTFSAASMSPSSLPVTVASATGKLRALLMILFICRRLAFSRDTFRWERPVNCPEAIDPLALRYRGIRGLGLLGLASGWTLFERMFFGGCYER